MVGYNMGQDRDASDIDGLGTELATTDTVTTNAFTLTFDVPWTNRAVDDITVSADGGLINEAGVSVTWDAGAVLNLAGELLVDGTSGSTVTWTNLTQITGNDCSQILMKYLTWNAGASYAFIDTNYSTFVVMIHCDITGTGNANTFMIPYNGKCPLWYINCTLTSANKTLRPTNGCSVYLFNTTITGGADWIDVDNNASHIYIIGTTNFAGAELTIANGINMDNAVLKYYSRIKVTVNDGTDPLQNAVITVRKKTGQSEIIFEPYFNDFSDAILDSKTDASGIGYVYVLTKVVEKDGTITYYSDENQAEAGDNSPYYISASYPERQSPVEAEVWGIENGVDNKDETNAGIISCLEVGGGRSPRIRRHGA